MMAVDGVADYATAKWKAARQAGLEDANLLPDNQEIEAALREYQELYQKEDQSRHLRELREIAARVMRDFAQFRPVLVGSVLNGTAGQFSDVNLHLYTDLSLVLAAGSATGIKGGVHVRYPKRTPMTNLLLTMLDKAGVPHVDKLGDSTGRLQLPEVGSTKLSKA